MENVYHQGEIQIQEKVGESLMAQSNGRVISRNIIKGAVNFIEKQPMAIVSSVDHYNQVWVSLLIGDYGFVSVRDEQELLFDKTKIHSDPKDIFFNNITSSGPVASLFIELETRRRFRINGTVTNNGHLIKMLVLEAYPNCPKFIQQREISVPEHFKKTSPLKMTGKTLPESLMRWIMTSDTLFVGSQSAHSRLDASHRGGPSGFVEILDDQTLKIPDYPGNSMYNTFGNIHQNPNVGLLFIDFEKKKTLQLTGEAELTFNRTTPLDMLKTSGTGRYWTFKTKQWILAENHHEVVWKFLSHSPYNPPI
ncbi:pyridoxamine 5'-phosphate oxidase family protein [Arenibacter sp. GZD96]|uniref:pyridoxamine 5'-phosphate oxidase family protein n=1 Tax=Aurantibrevibacter litoralis TaxID=3106030 RepID=UPI002B001BF7|nr:pyridoxamine 5'-phosphate oxidase family protein [Arenibacter sp. GZD-96]MEA1785446.1 pyridoxamine 5'-phosphate oxidase family protein [Arenibacter sp. GZD-96]